MSGQITMLWTSKFQIESTMSLRKTAACSLSLIPQSKSRTWSKHTLGHFIPFPLPEIDNSNKVKNCLGWVGRIFPFLNSPKWSLNRFNKFVWEMWQHCEPKYWKNYYSQELFGKNWLHLPLPSLPKYKSDRIKNNLKQSVGCIVHCEAKTDKSNRAKMFPRETGSILPFLNHQKSKSKKIKKKMRGKMNSIVNPKLMNQTEPTSLKKNWQHFPSLSPPKCKSKNIKKHFGQNKQHCESQIEKSNRATFFKKN